MIRLNDIIDGVISYHPDADIRLIEKAYVYSGKAHEGQVRLSGEPYLMHPLEVAGILVRMKLDVFTVASGLLHDTLEDTNTSADDLRRLFGDEVYRLVDGVTKIGRFEFSSYEERQAENVRKMILAMANDIRVILIKLADRLHNMRTLMYHAPAKQRLIAQETMDIYAPLAGRLGIDWIKKELEDLAFSFLHPEIYEEIVSGLKNTEEERQRYIEKVRTVLQEKLAEFNLSGTVSGRPKHIYSIYKKMVAQNLDLEHIYDIIAFRIILGSIRECYETLGMIHSLWKPIPGRFKDYIGMPKANMYQSLHTTVVGPYGERMEVQIRTEKMHKIANEGIAAHWVYKEGRSVPEGDSKRFAWLRQLLEWQQDLKDPREFLETVRVDLFPDEVYVFTPRGEVKAFPRGATPIDFAYSIHSEVGHRCTGAKVNGKLVSLKYQLRNGDIVEIITSPKHVPSKDWLKIVKTSRARTRIRHWIKTEERERSIVLGREICEREFRKHGLNFQKYLNSEELEKVARVFSLQKVEDLLASIGYGKISALQAVGKLASIIDATERPEEIPVERIEGKPQAPERGGVLVKGVDDILVRFAKCCNPLPGDQIVGFITRGRGVSVHKADCPNLLSSGFERRIDVEWHQAEDAVHPVGLVILCANVKGMLAAISGTLSNLDINIVEANVRTRVDNLAEIKFVLEVRDIDHLSRALAAVRKIDNVVEVHRSTTLEVH
ncbi:MAG: bifunctional (p)ppGpp synthetase/guanosine-3',5'-bis(diphosphate) 3'-pyrophosphohydrolase [Deltaproteobacteria bacterium]|nr:bifunctional (p)ppGpp synthetase/guanosine-3',5'-bis(diphosphate) 3'-pyrophosphohydrolase [Deltaproteobacteria bacterium]MBW2071285.1 bifunctional (p)ppGpp synthetase/guanosine-3',5'-bis(diphosphate) 3'-pyrophosphohydrolase [Deltaproteobacteria bacterium]